MIETSICTFNKSTFISFQVYTLAVNAQSVTRIPLEKTVEIRCTLKTLLILFGL